MNLTVGIVTRNRARYLKKCLYSLTQQRNKSFNVIVVDNNSSDATSQVLASFNKKLKLACFTEEKKGRSHARNKLLKESKAQILATIDDDCKASSNWTENIIKLHKENSNIQVLQGFAISIPGTSVVSNLAQFIHGIGVNQVPLQLIDTKNASFKLNWIKKNKLKFNTGFAHGEDFEFAKQILSKRGNIIFMSEIRVNHAERLNIADFLIQRFLAGRGVMKAQLLWSSRLFPEKSSIWWLKRLNSMFEILIKNKDQIGFLPLVIIERGVYLSGKSFEFFSYHFSSSKIKK